MPNRRNLRSKPHKLTQPRVLSFLAYTLVLFLCATILVNLGPNANSAYRQDWQAHYGTQKMQWVFVDSQGQRIDLDAQPEGEHASADRFEYLMPQNASGNQVSPSFSGEENEMTETSETQLGTKQKQEKKLALSAQKGYARLWNKIEDRSLFMSAVFEYLLRGDLVELPEGAARYVVAMYGLEPKVQQKVLEGKSCMTPRGYEIEDGDSVLAYEQRADAPFVCNIQRRSCENGKLSGTFVQKSCDEGKKGNIQTLPFLTLNDEANPAEELQGNITEQERRRNYLKNQGYIQPDAPVFEDADFNIHGKREKNPDPTTIALPAQDEHSQEADVNLSPQGKRFCETPRGERVRSGHFVKAYRFRNGFSDIPCQVQLRLCVEGNLEGTYQMPSCKPRMTSWEDFRDGYLDGEEPSIPRLMKMLEKEFVDNAEMSRLQQEVADQMRQYLRDFD